MEGTRNVAVYNKSFIKQQYVVKYDIASAFLVFISGIMIFAMSNFSRMSVPVKPRVLYADLGV